MVLANANPSLPPGFIYRPGVLSEEKSLLLYRRLRDGLDWQQPELTIYGKRHKIPRLQYYMGDADAAYSYSGQVFTPSPWLEELNAMRRRLVNQLQVPFNAVLINYYRNGHDSMGWHSDDEPELGDTPVIASVSLGARRLFKIRHKLTAETLDIPLDNASLLLMQGNSQKAFSHSLPKQLKVSGGRINLTFRAVNSGKGSVGW